MRVGPWVLGAQTGSAISKSEENSGKSSPQGSPSSQQNRDNSNLTGHCENQISGPQRPSHNVITKCATIQKKMQEFTHTLSYIQSLTRDELPFKREKLGTSRKVMVFSLPVDLFSSKPLSAFSTWPHFQVALKSDTENNFTFCKTM